jgi:hypothetical protein
MNLQVIAGGNGEIVWVSGSLPKAVHDLTAACEYTWMQHEVMADYTIVVI